MDLRIIVIDCGSSRIGRIEAALLDAGASITTVALAEADRQPTGPAAGLVISGGPHLFTGPEGDALRSRFAFLARPPAPVLGICLGHQAIGLSRGVDVFRGAERRGPERIDLLLDHPLVAGLSREGIVAEADHVEGIPLPDGFRRVARSRHYEVEIMADDARKLYGVQFHPEESGAAGRRLLANFLGLVRS